MVTRMQLKQVTLALTIALIINCGALAQQSATAKLPPPSEDKQDEFSAQLGKFAKRKAGAQKYTLAYKFKKGDVIRWKHDHGIVNVTKFGTKSVKTSTRAQPEYSWAVKKVDSRGNMRFEITMDRVKVWEQNGDADQVHYNSDTSKEVPDSCLIYKERVGRPTSTYSISPNGQTVASKSYYNQISLGGVGTNPVVAFPDKPIAIGHKWDVSNEVRADDEHGALQKLDIRVRYQLEKVTDGKAHITFSSEVMNPYNDETVRSQIVTHMARGFVVFDIEKGVLTNRETRWNERVIGYRGPESYMHYTATRKEILVQEKAVASKPAPVTKVAKKEPAGKPQQTHVLRPLNRK